MASERPKYPLLSRKKQEVHLETSAIYISILYVLAVILLVVYIQVIRTIQSLAFMIFFFVYATLELIVSCACLQNYETYGQNDVLVVNNVLPQPAYTNYLVLKWPHIIGLLRPLSALNNLINFNSLLALSIPIFLSNISALNALITFSNLLALTDPSALSSHLILHLNLISKALLFFRTL